VWIEDAPAAALLPGRVSVGQGVVDEADLIVWPAGCAAFGAIGVSRETPVIHADPASKQHQVQPPRARNLVARRERLADRFDGQRAGSFWQLEHF
jgi:hypothetical protein